MRYLNIADSDGTTVVVDAPAVLLDTVDTLGVADNVIDVHDEYGVVGIDVDVVLVVGRTIKYISIKIYILNNYSKMQQPF